MKAEFLYSLNNKDGYTKTLVYKYKGHEYMVTDYGWKGYSESLVQQHKDEQKRIDDILKGKEKHTIEHEFDLDEIFKIMEE